ncbi:hypothetical protein IscW_ISCW020838 [Ixodes scapularis]|uniref:Uncharacterized protein n=1 Tax=Ixodes scapularis TaxID=6945 RepID=B7Q299_IXOSC|nr:hypothetical protein IscW_ISCW020838 [Ixodes scapularis]|eukprot:XP_002410615.1 hypothetical protein IscW_ISCW020838 [Ixodes scapularis]
MGCRPFRKRASRRCHFHVRSEATNMCLLDPPPLCSQLQNENGGEEPLQTLPLTVGSQPFDLYFARDNTWFDNNLHSKKFGAPRLPAKPLGEPTIDEGILSND